MVNDSAQCDGSNDWAVVMGGDAWCKLYAMLSIDVRRELRDAS